MSGNRMFQALLAVAMFCIITTAVEAGSYNGNTAASYAYNNAYNDVTGSSYFRAHGGDCTNFVSNALQAGGWTEVKNGRTSDYSWYYDYTPYGYSYTWGAANNFYKFLTNSYRAYPVSAKYKKNLLQKGDIVQIDYKDEHGNYGQWDHSMIVTGKNGDDPLMSYHSVGYPSQTGVRNKSLTEIMNSNPDALFLGWKILSTY